MTSAPIASLLDNVIGAYPIDIDGDGHMDLFVLRVGQNLLLKGGPDCTFTLANSEWGFDGDAGWTTSFSAEWEKGQKFPTLAIGHYVDRNAPGSPYGTCEDNSLYRPQPGDKPDYSVRTPLAPGFCALSMLFTDWNRSGTPSLRVSNDRQYYRGGEEQMWRIEPGKPPKLYTRADGWRHVSIFGMGIAEGDIDGSGYPQYALTSMGDTKLQKLDPDEGGRGEFPVYRDIAGELGATAHIPYAGGDKRPSTGWHSEFADFNNAGLLDLFISKGNVAQMPDFAAFDPNNLLLGQWNGKFAEAGDAGGHRAQSAGTRRADRRFQSRRQARPARRQSRGAGRASSATSAPTMARAACCRWATGPKSASSSPTPTATRSAPISPSRPARARRCAPCRSAAATLRATRAGCMSASARPSARKSACNGRTESGAIPIACSPTNSSCSTGRSRRRNIGIPGASKRSRLLCSLRPSIFETQNSRGILMKLYYSAGSCALGIHVLLEEIGAPFELARINFAEREQYGPAYLAVSPKSKVPALQLDDGTVLTEFQAIAVFLGLTNPDKHLIPADARGHARMLEAMDYIVGTIHGLGFARIFRSAAFSPSEADHAAVKARGLEIANNGFALIEQTLAGKNWLAGDFSLADPALFYVTYWAAARLKIPLPPNVRGHFERMMDRPSVQKALKDEGL